MKLLFTVILLFWGAPGAHANSMALGDNFTCAWDGRSTFRPVCWGVDDQGQLDIPATVTNPFSMGGGAVHACALYYDLKAEAATKLQCWGDNDNRYQVRDIPPTIKNPLLLSVGRYHNCVIDQKGAGKSTAVCWGRNDHGQAPGEPSGLINPTAIYASSQHNIHFSCALHMNATKLKCWGDINIEVSSENFPTVYSGLPLSCDDRGTANVDCWSNRPETTPPNILSVTQYRTCRVDGTGLHCINSFGEPEVLPFAPKHTRELTLSRTHACTLDDNGMNCWGCEAGITACHKNKELRFGPVFEQFAQASEFLETLSEFVYEFDANFIRGVKRLMSLNGDATSDFLMAAFRPYLAEFGYRHLKREYLEQAVFNLDRLSTKMATFPSDVAAKKIRNSAAIQLLALSIQTASSVLTMKEKSQANRIVSDLGNAQMEGVISHRTVENVRAFYRSIAGNAYLTGRIMLGEGILGMIVDH
jgi:hypothetical protein